MKGKGKENEKQKEKKGKGKETEKKRKKKGKRMKNIRKECFKELERRKGRVESRGIRSQSNFPPIFNHVNFLNGTN